MKHKEDVNSDIENNQDTENSQNESAPEIEATDAKDSDQQNPDLAEMKDRFLRLSAEFENYKKRTLKEKIELSRMATADVFLSLLPIIDDLERALKSAEEAKDINSIKEGLNLISSKIKTVTSSKGLKAMDAIGKPFDAELYDAIANVPVEDKEMKGKVVEEIEKGYYLNDKVIRHAKVIVGN